MPRKEVKPFDAEALFLSIVDPEWLFLSAVFGPGVQPTSPEVKSARREAINQALATLKERERGILTLRFGFSGDGPRTLKEVASIEGNQFRGRPYTEEWIRQIEAKALRKLRHPGRKKFLTPCL